MNNLHMMLAAAYVRGHSMRTGAPAMERSALEKPLAALTQEEMESVISAGTSAGLKLYRFKRGHDELPRVKRVLGFLRSIQFDSLLDVGSGRGVFLLPFLELFPQVKVTSLDILPHRAQFLRDIARGGIDRLTPLQEDICAAPLPDGSADVVTMLEVLEHIPDVEKAVRNAVRIARGYVVVTVPSKPDNNPEHIHLLTKDVLTGMFSAAGCTRLHFDGVPGHLVMIAPVGAGDTK